MKFRPIFWVCLLLNVALACLTPAQAYAIPATQTPRPTCTECEIFATRAAGMATAWSLQLDPVVAQNDDQVVVRAVMFWMDSCGHCHYILDEVLPPLQAEYGEKLEILLIELKAAEDVDRLYQTAAALGLAKEEVAVPFLIIGDQVLIGSQEIPIELPGLIEQHLADGGIDYPALGPLSAVLPVPENSEEELCIPETPCLEEGTIPEATRIPDSADRTQSGILSSRSSAGEPTPDGFGLAITVLMGMIAALGYTGSAFIRLKAKPLVSFKRDYRNLAIPFLAILGLVIASYLAYVETWAVKAFCGPVGDCNMVQSSPYAKVFGFLPVGLVGIIGYFSILVVWMVGRGRDGYSREKGSLIIFSMALIGTIYSLYLTFLEPFVIRAVCVWCLSSAAIVTLLLLISVQPAMEVVARK